MVTKMAAASVRFPWLAAKKMVSLVSFIDSGSFSKVFPSCQCYLSMATSTEGISWTFDSPSVVQSSSPSSLELSPIEILVTRLATNIQIKKSARPIPRESMVDPNCDLVVNKCLREHDGNANAALSALKKFTDNGRFPSSSKTILAVTCVCARVGNLDGIRYTRSVCQLTFPDELKRLMNYRHYEAEAISKNGDYVKAFTIYKDLLKSTDHRKKLINISSFCLRDVVRSIDRELNVEQSAVLMTAASEFVDWCSSSISNWIPAANLWVAAINGKSYAAHCLAQTLLDKYADASDGFRASIADKITSIVRRAREECRRDIFQRLMQTLLALEMNECYSEVMTAYVDHLCDTEDLKAAREALIFMTKMSIYIDADTSKRLNKLFLKQRFNKYIKSLMYQIKPNQTLSVPQDYKYKF